MTTPYPPTAGLFPIHSFCPFLAVHQPLVYLFFCLPSLFPIHYPSSSFYYRLSIPLTYSLRVLHSPTVSFQSIPQPLSASSLSITKTTSSSSLTLLRPLPLPFCSLSHPLHTSSPRFHGLFPSAPLVPTAPCLASTGISPTRLAFTSSPSPAS